MIKSIAIIIAHVGYQPVEYGVPKKIFQEAGYKVVTVSDKPGKAQATDGSKTDVDVVLSKFDPKEYEAVVFVGGGGALEHLDNDISYRIIQNAVMANKVVAAICIAPRILAKAGALVSHTATGWDEDGLLKGVFDKHAVIYQNAPVIKDKRVVTAKGPAQAADFAHAVLSEI